MKNMLKVTICAYDAPGNIDGPTAWMKRLLPYLRNNEIEVRIIFFAAHHKKLAAYNHFKGLGFQCKIIYWDLFQEEKIMALLKDIKDNPPDIFIPNYFPFAFYASRYVQQAGIPVIMILHNDDLFHQALVEEYALNSTNVSAVVGVSKLITEMIYQTAPLHDNIHCIPYGAPIPPGVAKTPKGDKLNLVYAGRIVEPQKRISEVARAFCKVVKEVPETVCNIYGSGRAEPALKQILETEGKGLPINYGGKLESNTVQQYLLQNHIFVLLSDYEGIPISLMEAMSCGLVPVCSNIRSGMTELIVNGENGLLVNDRGDDFINAIRMLKENPAKWQQMSILAREKIVQEYSEEVCNAKWINLLRELKRKAGKQNVVHIPSIKEIQQQFTLRKEFAEYYNPRPSLLLIPFYRIKTWVGRMKRCLFKQIY